MMVEQHDFKKFPELTKRQLEEFGFQSPHRQITEDFEAKVVNVHDGDTIRVEVDFRDFDFPIRFLGTDAPEMNAGGKEARDWLRGRILNEMVQVIIDTKNRVDKYGRLLGKIMHRGSDVGDDMLRLGFVTTFENRREAQLPNLDKIFAIKQWLD